MKVYIWTQDAPEQEFQYRPLGNFTDVVWRLSWSVTGSILAVSSGDKVWHGTAQWLGHQRLHDSHVGLSVKRASNILSGRLQPIDVGQRCHHFSGDPLEGACRRRLADDQGHRAAVVIQAPAVRRIF
jgi:hypothetical protein